MTIFLLVFVYVTVGCIFYYQNSLRAPLFQVIASPISLILLWPLALSVMARKLWSPRRFRVGFAVYDPEQPAGPEISEYKFFASWAEAIVYAKELARSSGRKVTISDEARYDQGFSGYGPRWVTLAQTGEVLDPSNSHIRQKYTNEASRLEPMANPGNNRGVQAYKDGDYATAMREFRSSADNEEPSAMYYLGNMYSEGKGVSVNHREAAQWFLRAAERGHYGSQFALGCMYREGNGVTQNISETIRWWRKAAEQGDSMAQYNLGMMYAQGEGVREDPLEARQWVEKAAEQGETRAFYNLGNLYLAEPKDFVRAYMWWTLSVMNGENQMKADERRRGLESIMTSEQIAEAKKLAQEWTPKENKFFKDMVTDYQRRR